MKSLMNNTLAVAVAMTLWATAAMAGEVPNVPVDTAKQTDISSITGGTSTAPFHALSSLDTQSLATQELTDQELKAVEGGSIYSFMSNALTWYYSVELLPTTIEPLH